MIILFFILLVGFVLMLLFIGAVISLLRDKPKPIKKAETPIVTNTFVNR
jgi:hypothetical protein